MDEERLRQQYEQTGNILDVLHDRQILQESIQLEEACERSIGAGFPVYDDDLQPVEGDRFKAAMHQVRLQSILLSELEVFLQRANLGAGTEAAIVEARRRMRQQLPHFTEEQRQFLDAIVAEEDLHPTERTLRGQLQSRLHSFLSPADWSAIGQAATEAMQHQWLQFIAFNQIA